MRLFIQIPCFNEEHTLPDVIRDLPRDIEGVDEIFTLVIDDGSTDRTFQVARELGVSYVIRNHRNLGLAQSFMRGIEACLHLGADIVVNTDGDNQYCGDDIRELVQPILEGRADFVVGCRDIDANQEFSSSKKLLQKLGSLVVRRLSGTNVPDTTSGFRALRRSAAAQITLRNTFSHTLETLIQAGHSAQKVVWVPVKVNPSTRPSRLFRSNLSFIARQMTVLLAAFVFYAPAHFFGWLAMFFGSVSFALACRTAYNLWFVAPEFVKFKSGTGLLLSFTSTVTAICLACVFLGSVMSGLRMLLNDLAVRIRHVSLAQGLPLFDIDIVETGGALGPTPDRGAHDG